MTLSQDYEAYFIGRCLRRAGIILSYLPLQIVIVFQDFCDSQSSGVIDCAEAGFRYGFIFGEDCLHPSVILGLVHSEAGDLMRLARPDDTVGIVRQAIATSPFCYCHLV